VPAQGPDYSLHIRRLPGTARCGDNLPDIEHLHLVLKQQPIDSIPVADEIARGFSFVERLNQLLRSPGGGRMFCHVEVHKLTAIMTKNDENEQGTERSRGDGEEIDRSKFPDVVIQKRPQSDPVNANIFNPDEVLGRDSHLQTSFVVLSGAVPAAVLRARARNARTFAIFH
jgi:hypothetical protein